MRQAIEHANMTSSWFNYVAGLGVSEGMCSAVDTFNNFLLPIVAKFGN